jgi:hypothetical protein
VHVNPQRRLKGVWRAVVLGVGGASVWMGSGGNITPFHYDLCHGFLVQILGEKTFTLVAPEDFRCMYQRGGRPELSRVDLEAWRAG